MNTVSLPSMLDIRYSILDIQFSFTLLSGQKQAFSAFFTFFYDFQFL